MRGPVFALALALVAGCATPPHPPPGRLPEPADLTGSWLSNWGAMALRQDGAEVTGTYEHRSGRLQGRVDGDLLLFEWEQPGSRAEGVLAARGKGWMRITAGGGRLAGVWGYRDLYEGGGVWEAERDLRAP